MAICNRKCADCSFADCIDDSFSPTDYLDLIDLEKSLGVYLPEDEKYFYDDLLIVVLRERRKERLCAYVRDKRQKERFIDNGRENI